MLAIRRPELPEHSTVRALVQTVVDEIYGHLWASPPLAIDEENWGLAWIAILDENIVGMVLTHQEWISDLWVLPSARRQGIGGKLLAQGEAEIRDRGYRTFRLRVVKSNTAAIRFYQCHEWQVKREFTHENLPAIMLEMSKEVYR